MEYEEFEEKMDTINKKLSPEEEELLNQVISGASVRNTALYIIVAFCLGIIGGFFLASIG